MNKILKLIKRVHLKDFLAPFIFLIILIPSLIFRMVNKLKKRRLWLIAEEGEARDNGYWFYKYVRENYPRDYCFYAVKRKSAGKKKVEELQNIIYWGSLKHWLYYMSADLNISSQTSGNPNTLFWLFIHVYLGLYKNRVFLQHGVTLNDALPLRYNRTKFKYFITTSQAEYDEISKNFGYPSGSVLLTGFPRWDNLVNFKSKEQSILIMPTWRQYLGIQNNALFNNIDFEKTEYFRAWNGLLKNKKFINFIEENNIDVYFYPHQHVQEKIKLFGSSSKNIKIVSMDEDIQEYISKCALMITDYSSVMFDFSYLDKPVICYQFDQENFREKQHGEGYFSYEKDGFGPVVKTEEELLDVVIKKQYEGRQYTENNKRFFGKKITNCSEKLYLALKNEKPLDRIFVNKKVTIIIPTYNAEKYIKSCLNSVINQSYENIEIIIIDDGSTDNTAEIVEAFIKKDSRIKLIKNKHAGPNVARAAGIEKASGKYVMFADADDLLKNNAVEEVVKAFSKNDVDIIRFNYQEFPNGKEARFYIDNKKILNQEEIINVVSTTYSLNSLWSQAYRKEILKDYKIFKNNMIYAEDLLANLKIYKNVKKMLILDKVLYLYRKNNSSSTMNNKDTEHLIMIIKNRIFTSNEIVKNAITTKNLNLNNIMYSQLKMIKGELSKLDNPSSNQLKEILNLKETEEIRSSVSKDELMSIIQAKNISERLKNRKILLDIYDKNYSSLQKRLHFYRKIRRIIR